MQGCPCSQPLPDDPNQCSAHLAEAQAGGQRRNLVQALWQARDLSCQAVGRCAGSVARRAQPCERLLRAVVAGGGAAPQAALACAWLASGRSGSRGSCGSSRGRRGGRLGAGAEARVARRLGAVRGAHAAAGGAGHQRHGCGGARWRGRQRQ